MRAAGRKLSSAFESELRGIGRRLDRGFAFESDVAGIGIEPENVAYFDGRKNPIAHPVGDGARRNAIACGHRLFVVKCHMELISGPFRPVFMSIVG